MNEWVRFGIAAALMLTGVACMILSVVGVYRFKYVLNRMHAAAIGDTMGILCLLGGVMVIYGLSFETLKLALVIALLWMASPVSSHLISRLEVTTGEDLDEHMEVRK